MPPFYPTLVRHSFLCRPDWRWQRAHFLIESGLNFSRRRDDELTGRAVRYLRAVQRCRVARSALGRGMDLDIHAARMLAERDDSTTMIVQALMLARQSPLEIAERTSVEPRIIDIYEVLFFDCRDRLNSRDWVAMHALGSNANGSTTTARSSLLKQFAYYGGPLVLDAMMPYLVGDQTPFETPLDLTTAAGRTEQSIRLAIAAHLVPAGAKTDRFLQQMMLLILEHDQDRQLKAVSAPTLATWASSALKDGHFDLIAVQADDTADRVLTAHVEAVRQAA